MIESELWFLVTLDMTPAFWYSDTRRSKKFVLPCSEIWTELKVGGKVGGQGLGRGLGL